MLAGEGTALSIKETDMLGPGPQLGALGSGWQEGFLLREGKRGHRKNPQTRLEAEIQVASGVPRAIALYMQKSFLPSQESTRRDPGAIAPEAGGQRGARILGRGLRGGAPFGRAEAGASRLWWQLEREGWA